MKKGTAPAVGSFIEMKAKLLGVSAETLRQYGAVSEQTAREMVEGVLRVYGADVGVALTGVAGPLPQPGEPGVAVGTVCLAVVSPDGSRATTLRLGENAGREQVRQFSVINALDLVRRHLAGG